MKFVKYKIDTGEVLAKVNVPTADFPAEDGVAYFPVDDLNKNWEETLIINNQLTTRPAKPSDNHFWIDGQWQVDLIGLAEKIRAQRDVLLTETDWVVSKAYETQTVVPQEWVQYRQALRDIPQQNQFPADVVFPIKPN